MSSSMRWRSAVTGRSVVETGIASSSQDEGNSMLERQPRSVQDVMEHGRLPAAEGNGSLSFWTSIEVQGLGPWRGLGQRPNLTLLQRSIIQMPGRTQPQHHSREAGSCLDAKPSAKRTYKRPLPARPDADDWLG